MRPFLILLLVLGSMNASAASSEAIPIHPDIIGTSMADRVRYVKDPDHELSIAAFLEEDLSERYQTYPEKRKNFGFTDATIWVEGKLRNRMKEEKRFFLQAARALTNKVNLYLIEEGKVVDTMQAGDHVAYQDRLVDSRKNVFPIQLEPDAEKRFLIELRSDHESLVFPLIIWTPRAFFTHERTAQLRHGFFYGIFVFVFLLFGFFYKVLRERSFLYYVLYILCFGLLQFSLDGYSYRFFFWDWPYMADLIMRLGSSLTILMLLLYARAYLKIPQRSPALELAFRGFIGMALFLFLVSFLPSSLSSFANPALNSFSFIAVLFVLFSIFYLKNRKYEVSNYFMTAYLWLIAGAVIFILGNTGVLESSPLTLNALKYGGLGEVIFLSFSMAEKYRSIQKEKEEAQQRSIEQMQELNRVKDEYNKELEQEVAQRTHDLEREREKLDAINREMMSSIRYAERIQRAILPSEEKFKTLFEDRFVFFRPRDIVSGDIYWCSAENGKAGKEEPAEGNEEDLAFSGLSRDPIPNEVSLRLFSVMDCTGHGVPGAFLTFLGQSILTRAKKELSVQSPANALRFVDRELRATLSEIRSETQVEDGMEMGLCALDKEKQKLYFAGAGHDCYIVREGTAHVLKGDRQSIGGSNGGSKFFTDKTFDVQEGDMIYLFSDGYPDQFGGPHNKKFKYRPFRELLCELYNCPSNEQQAVLERTLNDWKGELEQVDDICVMGVRV